MQWGKMRLVSAILASVVAATALGVAPTVAQDEPQCRGGMPDYWLENPWPEPFRVPRAFRKPNGQRAIVRPWTKFDAVYRYRAGRDSEGPIFPRKTLKQVLTLTRDSKQSLARQAVAALLNAAERDSNDFWNTKYAVIKNFQVYWDGTEDMGKRKARIYMRNLFRQWNSEACPTL